MSDREVTMGCLPALVIVFIVAATLGAAAGIFLGTAHLIAGFIS